MYYVVLVPTLLDRLYYVVLTSRTNSRTVRVCQLRVHVPVHVRRLFAVTHETHGEISRNGIREIEQGVRKTRDGVKRPPPAMAHGTYTFIEYMYDQNRTHLFPPDKIGV